MASNLVVWWREGEKERHVVMIMNTELFVAVGLIIVFILVALGLNLSGCKAD